MDKRLRPRLPEKDSAGRFLVRLPRAAESTSWVGRLDWGQRGLTAESQRIQEERGSFYSGRARMRLIEISTSSITGAPNQRHSGAARPGIGGGARRGPSDPSSVGNPAASAPLRARYRSGQRPLTRCSFVYSTPRIVRPSPGASSRISCVQAGASAGGIGRPAAGQARIWQRFLRLPRRRRIKNCAMADESGARRWNRGGACGSSRGEDLMATGRIFRQMARWNAHVDIRRCFMRRLLLNVSVSDRTEGGPGLVKPPQGKVDQGSSLWEIGRLSATRSKENQEEKWGAW